MRSIKNILFDLDGTIIEPEEGIINSVLYALNKLGIEEKSTAELKGFIGPPLIDSFTDRYSLTKTEANKAVNHYREFFSEKGIYQNTLYNGITDLLQELSDKGFRLFLATSKPTVFAKRIIAHFQLDHFFEDIVGSNLDNTRKDKTEIIEYLINLHDLRRSETIMIGDRKFDIIGAKNNSILSIGVTYGHGSNKELQDSNADLIVSSCLELQRLILNITAADQANRPTNK